MKLNSFVLLMLFAVGGCNGCTSTQTTDQRNHPEGSPAVRAEDPAEKYKKRQPKDAPPKNEQPRNNPHKNESAKGEPPTKTTLDGRPTHCPNPNTKVEAYFG